MILRNMVSSIAIPSILLLFIPFHILRAIPDDGLRLSVQARGFRKPLQIVFSPGDPQAMYVVEQAGKIYRLRPKSKKLFANLSPLISDSSGEQGLLGLAFPPSYSPKNGLCYVNYTSGKPLYTHIAELKVRKWRAQIKKKGMRKLLRIRQPYTNHNGGMLAFGADGKLYIATGDGGAAGDPLGAGQDTRSLLGKILRIDVKPTHSKPDKTKLAGLHKQRIDVKPTRPKPYSIPSDNPFVKNTSFRPEIYAFGLRNPWRFSFDRKTRRLYAADVGQNRREEINLIVRGGNYGWNIREGNLCYKPAKNCKHKGLLPPIYSYSHSQGQSITGGYVYRGKRLKKYRGYYFYADFVSGKLWALPLKKASGKAAGSPLLLLKKVGNIASFGEDLQGELYIAAYRQGVIYKLIPSKK